MKKVLLNIASILATVVLGLILTVGFKLPSFIGVLVGLAGGSIASLSLNEISTN